MPSLFSPKRALLVTALTLVSATAAGAQTTLQPKPQEGKSTTQVTFKLNQTLNVAGMDVKTDVDSAATVVSNAAKPAADGTQRTETKTEATTVKLTAPGIDVNFDSKNPDAAKSDIPQIQALIDVWKASTGSPYTIVTDKKGEITALEGVDKIIEKAPPGAAEALKAEFNLAKVKREALQALRSLPDKAVNKGDRWARTEIMSVGGGQTFTLEIFYEYAGTVEKGGKTLDKVAVFISEVKYALEPDAPLPFKVAASDLKVAGSTGYYLFDRELGAVVERYGNTHITGPMTLDINGMIIPAMLDLTFDTLTVTKKQ